MKKLLVIASLSVVLVLAACGSADTSTSASITVLENYYAALTAGDLDKAMSYVADNAVFIDPMGKYVGLEKIRAAYEGQMKIGGSGNPRTSRIPTAKAALSTISKLISMTWRCSLGPV